MYLKDIIRGENNMESLESFINYLDKYYIGPEGIRYYNHSISFKVDGRYYFGLINTEVKKEHVEGRTYLDYDSVDRYVEVGVFKQRFREIE